MKIQEVILEMPMKGMLGSGWRDDHPSGFRVGKVVRGNMLKRGMKLSASYSLYNEGIDYIEVLGFTNNKEKYGEGGVKYNSVKDIFRAHRGVASLKQLYELDQQSEYGYSHYMCVRDISPDERSRGMGDEDDRQGCWYYLNEKGRWCRGSGMEPLSFRELNFAPAEHNET